MRKAPRYVPDQTHVAIACAMLSHYRTAANGANKSEP